ncbi:MAG: hypothetical protein KKI09_06155 [Spirochaetes bacterium]|nr:hypothetical protein [Spirochaetota bacterium]MBU0954994.1 hypothetical protein [Spirochaetota bacterium]
MYSRRLLPVLLYAALLMLVQPQRLPAQTSADAIAGSGASASVAADGSEPGQTNVLVDRVEILPANFPLGSEIRMRIFFDRTAGVLEYSRPSENLAVGMLPPDIISLELTPAADGLECLVLQLIAWSPGQNWLKIPEYQGLVFPPLSFQVQSALDAGYQPDLLGQLEVRGFRYQLIALLAALALFLLLLLGLAIFLPGLRLAAAGRRRTRRALRLLERQLRQLEKNADSDATAWQSFIRVIGEFLQERLSCPDYLRWRDGPDADARGQGQPQAETQPRPELPFLPALATTELQQLPPDWLPPDVRNGLMLLLRRGEAVCWEGRPDPALPAAVQDMRVLVNLLETRLQDQAQSNLKARPQPAESELPS